MTKTALITGASRGLGAALAEALAKDYHVIAVARTTGALEELDDRIQAIGGQATLAPMDVTKPDAMAHLCRSIFDRWGHLDMWIHTAVHAPPLAPVAHMDGRDFDKTMVLNVTALGRLIPMIEPLLLAADGGQAIFFDDAVDGQKFFGAYGASKAAQRAMIESWANETRSTGPRVRLMTPPAMPTATRARFFPGEDREALTSPADAAAMLLSKI